MPAEIKTDICVIGAGSGGLSVAAGASQMGARTVLIEKGRMGGDCLNFGCVPSKALLAAAHAAEARRTSAAFGIDSPNSAGAEPAIDFARVHAHVHGVIGAIAPMDSEARFTAMGVQVLRGVARFTGPRAVAVGDTKIRAKWFVVATGSRPAAPPIDGLDGVPYLTNETVFDLTDRPDHLVIVGGGPIGIELAQAFRQLGSRVTVIEGARILGPGDPELVQLLRTRLKAEGVDLREGLAVKAVRAEGGGVAVDIAPNGGANGNGEPAETVTGSHLLVATGRAANVDDLGLEAAGVDYDSKGIRVDAGLRSSNKRVFAVGDVAGGPQFTHLAGYHAGIVIRRILFRMFWAKADLRALPAVTYTEPELAQVGLLEAAARAKGPVTVLRWPFAENDRAQAERTTEGLIKVLATAKGRILGVHILGPHAGELIQPWVLAIQNGLKLRHMAGYIAPYPTLGEVGKRAAGTFYYPSLFSARTKRVVRFLMRLA